MSGIVHHGNKPNGNLKQLFWPMRNFTFQRQTVTWLKMKYFIAVPIQNFPFDYVKHFSTWMGKGRKFLTGIIHTDQIGFEIFMWAAGVGEQMISMSFIRATPYH